MEKKFLIKFLFITILISFGFFCFAQEKSIPNLIKNVICIQVITPAKNPVTGECKEFLTPCDVPQGWQKVKSCKGLVITLEPEKKPITCKEYFWYDESNLECQGPKTFCGAFMYFGLQIFEKKEDCEKNLVANPKFKEKKKQEFKKEIQEKSELSLENIVKIFNKINFVPGNVEIDGEKISVDKEKIFTEKMAEREIKILVSPEKIMIKEDDKTVTVEGKLTIENEKLFFEGKEIKLTPNRIFEKLKIQNPLNLEMKLKLEDENPVYLMKFIEEKKILGIFPIKIQKEIEVLAQTEEIEKLKEIKKPWWFFGLNF